MRNLKLATKTKKKSKLMENFWMFSFGIWLFFDDESKKRTGKRKNDHFYFNFAA